MVFAPLKKHLYRTISYSFQKAFFVPLLYWMFGSLGLILNVWRSGDIHLNSKISFKDSQNVFDFVIVGSGSSGSVLANRLSKHYSVLLLEAGGEPNPLQAIPGFFLNMLNYPETDWGYRTVPQKFGSLNSVNQRSSWSSGRTLGGTGTLNGLLYLRGHPKDFDNWAKITGDGSWSYDSVTHYFKDLETYADPHGHKRYHGFHGELSVELPAFTGLGHEFVQAGQEFGFAKVDLNAKHSEGFSKTFYTTRYGVRHSSYRAFLQPRRLSRSLTIRKYAHVNKILFKENSLEAYGVEYDRNGVKRIAVAKREVIISAGAVATPKLLMLSGIGPKDHLKEFDIPLKQDLPVGKHLQDHIGVFVGPIFIRQPKTVLVDRDLTAGAFVDWFATGEGVLTTTGPQAAAVFTSSYAKSRGEHGWPDLKLLLFGQSVHQGFASGISHSFGLKLDEMKHYYSHAIGKESFHLIIAGARPYARGYVKLASKSPYDSPVIDPKYLSDKSDIDLKVLVEGIKAGLQLAENTTTFKELGARFTEKPLPGCEHLPFRSDEYWACYARRYTVTLHHPCCTAAMGKKDSAHAVVDPELRVHGIKNLRVVDTSIMPVIIGTNTQAAAMMIGNKASHLILSYWKKIDSEIAQERKRKQSEQNQIKHSQLMEYIFEPLNEIRSDNTARLEIQYSVAAPKIAAAHSPLLSKIPTTPNPKVLTKHTNEVQFGKHSNELPPVTYSSEVPLNVHNYQEQKSAEIRPTLMTKLVSPLLKSTLLSAKVKPRLHNCNEIFECWASKFPPRFPHINL